MFKNTFELCMSITSKQTHLQNNLSKSIRVNFEQRYLWCSEGNTWKNIFVSAKSNLLGWKQKFFPKTNLFIFESGCIYPPSCCQMLLSIDHTHHRWQGGGHHVGWNRIQKELLVWNEENPCFLQRPCSCMKIFHWLFATFNTFEEDLLRRRHVCFWISPQPDKEGRGCKRNWNSRQNQHKQNGLWHVNASNDMIFFKTISETGERKQEDGVSIQKWKEKIKISWVSF